MVVGFRCWDFGVDLDGETTVNPAPKQVNTPTSVASPHSGATEALAMGTAETKTPLITVSGALERRRGPGTPCHLHSGQRRVRRCRQPRQGPDDAWAVGTSFNGGAGAAAALRGTLIEHWDGSSWSTFRRRMGSPTGTGLVRSRPGRRAEAQTIYWAAGWYLNHDGDTLALLFEYWNGSTWDHASDTHALWSAQIASGIAVVGRTMSGRSGQPVAPGPGAELESVRPGSSRRPPDITSKDSQNELSAVSTDSAGDLYTSGYAYNVNDENFAVALSCAGPVRRGR